MTSIVQKLAWAYAALFVIVVVLGYVPGVEDAQGNMFGLFKIDLIDDLLHLASAIWAGTAAWHSARYAVFYFKWFGVIYLLDGIVGVIAGKGFLDFAIFLGGEGIADIGTRIAANVPHIMIGGFAMFVGFYLARRYPVIAEA